MSWDPFLIKKWLKSGICGTMNSAFVHYSRLTWSNSAARTKKKRTKRDFHKTLTRNAESKQAL